MEKNKQALLIVDMINDFQHEDGGQLYRQVLPVAEKIAELKRRAHVADAPVIFVNDNFKKWHDSFNTTIRHVEESSDEGKRMVEILQPTEEDYYVLKPHRSAFYKTPLGVLLEELDVEELIITGSATDMCVLSTAHDAQMRKYKLRVPRDCTASIKNEHKDQALDLMARVLDADVSPSDQIEFM